MSDASPDCQENNSELISRYFLGAVCYWCSTTMQWRNSEIEDDLREMQKCNRVDSGKSMVGEGKVSHENIKRSHFSG